MVVLIYFYIILTEFFILQDIASLFLKIYQCFDFRVTNAKNTVLYKYTIQNSRNILRPFEKFLDSLS